MPKSYSNNLIIFDEKNSNKFLEYLEADQEKAREMIKNKEINNYYDEVHIYEKYLIFSNIKTLIKYKVFQKYNENLFFKDSTEILPVRYSAIILFDINIKGNILRKNFKNWIFLNKGEIRFDNACFNSDGDVSFNYTQFSNNENLNFNNTQFNNKGIVDFSNVKFYNKNDVFFCETKFNNNDFVFFFETIFGSIKTNRKIDIYFRNIEINNKFIYYELKGNSNIFFENINFINKKACLEFQRIHLEDLQNREIIIKNCMLTNFIFTESNKECFNFIGQNWGKSYRIKSIEEEKLNKNLKNKKLNRKEKVKEINELQEKYCGLKAMFKKNENYVMIAKFHAGELAMQRIKKGFLGKIFCWEFLYWISSYYGTIWWLPLLWYIILIIVLSIGSYFFMPDITIFLLPNTIGVDKLKLLFKYFIYNAIFIKTEKIFEPNENDFFGFLFLIISKIHQVLSLSLLIMTGFIIKRKFKS